MNTGLHRAGERMRVPALLALSIAASTLLACACRDHAETAGESPRERPATATLAESERSAEREAMVREQIEARGVRDARVLAALRQIPRHRFVPPEMESRAYEDHPLPIGYEQTISQPYIVAFMSEALALTGGEKVLEIGTGSGYQAAVLSKLAREVYTIEIVPELSERARKTLEALGYVNVHARAGDGYRGWPAVAPFDAIMLTAAPDHVPEPLLDQLAPGGRLILPVGNFEQELVLLRKTANGIERQRLLPVRFVPMTGEAQKR